MRILKRIDCVYMDLHGSIKTPTMTGAKYFLLLVDVISRKMWVYFLNKKSNCFSKFVAWKALVEKQTGKQVKALRSDNGGEFVSTQFKEFCRRKVYTGSIQLHTLHSKME
jgi:hypothetical protein